MLENLKLLFGYARILRDKGATKATVEITFDVDGPYWPNEIYDFILDNDGASKIKIERELVKDTDCAYRYTVALEL